MSDFTDTLLAAELANSNRPTRQDIADGAATSRARNIQDNFGIKPEPLGQFQKEHGGGGALKFLGWAAAGLAVGLMFHFVMAALVVGSVVGAMHMGHQRAKVRQGYNDYLDNVASQGRAMRDHTVAIEYDNGTGKGLVVAEEARRLGAAQAQMRI